MCSVNAQIGSKVNENDVRMQYPLFGNMADENGEDGERGEIYREEIERNERR